MLGKNKIDNIKNNILDIISYVSYKKGIMFDEYIDKSIINKYISESFYNNSIVNKNNEEKVQYIKKRILDISEDTIKTINNKIKELSGNKPTYMDQKIDQIMSDIVSSIPQINNEIKKNNKLLNKIKTKVNKKNSKDPSIKKGIKKFNKKIDEIEKKVINKVINKKSNDKSVISTIMDYSEKILVFLALIYIIKIFIELYKKNGFSLFLSFSTKDDTAIAIGISSFLIVLYHTLKFFKMSEEMDSKYYISESEITTSKFITAIIFIIIVVLLFSLDDWIFYEILMKRNKDHSFLNYLFYNIILFLIIFLLLAVLNHYKY